MKGYRKGQKSWKLNKLRQERIDPLEIMQGGSTLFVHCSACSKNIVSFACNGFGPFWIYSLRHLELQNVWYFPSLPKPPCPPSLASKPQLSHRLETSSALGLFDIPSSSVLLTQIAYDVFRHGFFFRQFRSHPLGEGKLDWGTKIRNLFISIVWSSLYNII